eukprot:TRINITY_DN15243_c0_g1_i1.p1 TRINITY_DN15243_c0_g1~~TRINITY_DN15243_c0_g1_i1.p1  ORF type:complete len:552 (+),score=101.38 TRINITY_DN15243_c0_g1_i1:175-1830(+)
MKLSERGGLPMPRNPTLIMVSVDCASYAQLLIEKKFKEAATYLADGVERLLQAGAGAVVLCSNTAHLAAPMIVDRFPQVPLLHIADTTATAIKAAGKSRVGLLGTEPTMREDYLKSRLAMHGVEVIVPDSDDDLRQIFTYIMDELGQGVFSEPTRAFFVDQARKLAARGAQGVICGCTEIELLLRQQDTPELQLFPSAALHIEAATKLAVGLVKASDFAPPQAQRTASPQPSLRVFGADLVRRLLPMSACVESAEKALRACVSGSGAGAPLRLVTKLPLSGGRFGVLATMPAYLGGLCSCKSITVFPGNAGTQFSAHQGTVTLFEGDENGRVLAVCDAHELTLLRTAAASAVATKVLSTPDSKVLALLGTGPQAKAHFEAISLVRSVEQVNIWGRTAAKAEAVAAQIRELSPDTRVSVSGTARDAVADADIVCTLTPSTEPILQGAWLKAGVHVNAVGACTPAHRELDTEAVKRSRLFTDTKEACLKEPGDIVVPLEAGEISETHLVAEVGAVLAGQAEGRRGPSDITLFESLGCALEDLCAAEAVYRRAG